MNISPRTGKPMLGASDRAVVERFAQFMATVQHHFGPSLANESAVCNAAKAAEEAATAMIGAIDRYLAGRRKGGDK